MVSQLSYYISDMPITGCSCHNMETFKQDWRPDIPSELEQIVGDGYCAHVSATLITKKLGFYPIHVAVGELYTDSTIDMSD